MSSREQRSEASDVEAGTDKPSSCKQSNKKMFKVGLQENDFQFVSSLTKDMICTDPDMIIISRVHGKQEISRSAQAKSWNMMNSKKYEP